VKNDTANEERHKQVVL